MAKEFEINSFDDLHKAIQEYSAYDAIFRGMKSVEHQLKPSVGRMRFISRKSGVKPDRLEAEMFLFGRFKRQAIPYLEFTPVDDWDWLTLAQHHGLPTRLLDWTFNPLVAAYFAVEDDAFVDSDGVIYACETMPYVDREKSLSPFKVRSIRAFIPKHITRRLIAQDGLFTIHPEPAKELKRSKNIDRLIIKKTIRNELKEILFRYGIHEASLFPDLDGLASHIKWLREDWPVNISL